MFTSLVSTHTTTPVQYMHPILTGFWLHICEASDQGWPVSKGLRQKQRYQNSEGGGGGCRQTGNTGGQKPQHLLDRITECMHAFDLSI